MLLENNVEGAIQFCKDMCQNEPEILFDIGVLYADNAEPADIGSALFFLETAWEHFQYGPALLELSDIAAMRGNWGKMAEYLHLADTLEVPHRNLTWVTSLSYLFQDLDDTGEIGA